MAVVDKVAKRHGTEAVAKAYLEYLYSSRRPGNRRQEIFIVRASTPSRKNMPASFPRLKLFTVDEVFGGWAKAQKTHFADGGIFDQISQKKP